MSAEASNAAWLRDELDDERLVIETGGSWVLDQLASLDQKREKLLLGLRGRQGSASISLRALASLDTAGAWLIHRLERDLTAAGWTVAIEPGADHHQALLDEVCKVVTNPPAELPAPNPILRVTASFGEGVIHAIEEAARLLTFFGHTMVTLFRVLLHPGRARWTAFTHHLEQTCLNALPIVGLIAFLIGIVMAYQGADQLRRFGAEIFTVDLLGVTILREIGILLTSIVVAGRSGSAFTAEIGAMAVNEEVDAMQTLGLDPFEVLVLPRLLALMVALPLLVFFADMLALTGGGLMAWFVLDISPGQFLTQLDSAISPATFWVGMAKAPVFAFLIAMVGCYQGLRVTRSAESVGRQTTKSVVVSIFLVIVFDALFSIMFSYLGV